MSRIPLIAFFKRKLVYHLIFWLLYYAAYFIIIVYGTFGIRDAAFYWQSLPFIAADIGLVYVNFYLLIPRFLSRRRYAAYGLLLLLVMGTGTLLNIALRTLYAKLGSPVFAGLPPLNIATALAVLAERFYLVGLTSSIKVTKDWLRSQKQMKQKEKYFLETELSFLKSQIQPHFFFNTLNNLYSLTLQKSDKAPEVVLKLSELMSYMLYGSNSSTVSLSDEIDYLQNYIDLEKLRFGNRLAIDFHVSGEPIGYRIPPLLLILFVENSFKHGVRNTIGSTEIKVCLSISATAVSFRIENPVSTDVNGSGGGIGLRNVRRRLDLLYGDDYKLETCNEAGRYIAALTLPLSVGGAFVNHTGSTIKNRQ